MRDRIAVDAFLTSRALWLSAILLTTAVLLNGLFRGASTFWDYGNLSERERELSEAVEKLRANKDAISLEIQKIKSSPIYAKRILKDRYHQVEQDETMIFVAEDGSLQLDQTLSADHEVVVNNVPTEMRGKE